ncbi:unnamed protein product [Orchesella dallaii]|uniref:DOMON domain-containing protein n=1 Tax=Orchesella dallaii TaxID=48710 RepID=A0ABP1PKS6_9HEXA
MGGKSFQILQFSGLFFFLFFGILFQIKEINCQSQNEEDSEFTQSLILDNPRGSYLLDQKIDWSAKRAVFNVTVKTTGFIGFGLSKNGEMEGADIVIGGVASNGEPYFTDRHGVRRGPPQVDKSQDWKLDQSWEENGTTFLSFSRPLNTCDEENDVVIRGNEKVTLLWAFGETDEVEIEPKVENSGTFETSFGGPNGMVEMGENDCKS